VHERKGQDKPFFLSLHFTAPHWPWEGPDDEHVAHSIKDLFHYDGGSLKKYGEIVEALDKAVGQVLQALDDSGQADNTIVIFTSDNGGERFSKTWPFTGQKTELLEGGIRVPTLLRWSARIQPQVQEQVTASFDWLPTLLAAAGARPHPDFPSDGQNILPILEGHAAPTERSLFWRYKSQTQRAVRQGPGNTSRSTTTSFCSMWRRTPASAPISRSISQKSLPDCAGNGRNGTSSCCPSRPKTTATASRPIFRPTAMCRHD
jgi:arylsulfatase A-like enzyme